MMETPNLRSKSICLPFESEAEYRELIEDAAMFRQVIEQSLAQYPELFPAAIGSGFAFHSFYHSAKQDILLRRIKIAATR